MSDRDPTPLSRPNDDDATLLRLAAAGDRGAFGVLVRRHLRAAVANAVDLLGDLDEAEDVVQDAFLIVQRKARDFDATRPFAPWLHGIVRNCARRRRERAARRRRLLRLWWRADQEAGTAANTDSPALPPQLTNAIDALPEMQRRCFTLHFGDSVPVTQIALQFGIAKSTVRQHLFRARGALRRQLADLDVT